MFGSIQLVCRWFCVFFWTSVKTRGGYILCTVTLVYRSALHYQAHISTTLVNVERSTMTTTTRGVTLYPHNASALLPLLETRQPLSLPLIGSIHVSGAARVYATFPPSQIPTNGGDDWAVAIAFPAPSTQLHVYHAFESADRAGNGKAEPAGHDEPAACVVALLHLMLALHPTHDRIGGLNILWAAAVREALKSPDYGWNTVYLAPAGGVAAEGVGVDMAGLALDKGKPGDEDCVSPTQDSIKYKKDS
jgi:hypothetical protein